MAIYKTLLSCASFGVPGSEQSLFYFGTLGNSTGKNRGIAYESESWYAHHVRTAGVISGLAALRSGSASGEDTVTVRVSGVDSALSVSTQLDGNVSQNTGSVAVSGTDYVTLSHTRTDSFSWIRGLYEPSVDGQVSLFTVCGQGNGFFIGTPIAWDRYVAYTPFCGDMRTSSPATNEEETQVRVKTAGTFRNARLYVVFNNLDGEVLLRSRVNGAYGNISITIPAGTTGEFTDYSNTDVLDIDDEYCFEASLGVNGWADFSTLSVEYHHSADDGEFEIYAGTPGVATSCSASIGSYTPPMGDISFTGSETAVAMSFGMECGAKKFRCHVTINTCTADQVFVVRKNFSDTILTFTVPAGEIGEFIDDINEISISSNDLISIGQTGGGTGALGVQYFAMVIPAGEVEAEPGGRGVTFSLFKDEGFKDWREEADTSEQTPANFNSYLYTYYHFVDDQILWMQAPYIYTYVNNTSRNGDSPSLFMNGIWDWSEDSSVSHKVTRDTQVYTFKTDTDVSNSKNRIRGSGRALKLKYYSEPGKDWNLLGWNIHFDKNGRY